MWRSQKPVPPYSSSWYHFSPPEPRDSKMTCRSESSTQCRVYWRNALIRTHCSGEMILQCYGQVQNSHINIVASIQSNQIHSWQYSHTNTVTPNTVTPIQSYPIQSHQYSHTNTVIPNTVTPIQSHQYSHTNTVTPILSCPIQSHQYSHTNTVTSIQSH